MSSAANRCVQSCFVPLKVSQSLAMQHNPPLEQRRPGGPHGGPTSGVYFLSCKRGEKVNFLNDRVNILVVYGLLCAFTWIPKARNASSLSTAVQYRAISKTSTVSQIWPVKSGWFVCGKTQT